MDTFEESMNSHWFVGIRKTVVPWGGEIGKN